MRIDLSGRTAFVSGSTQGIGRAIAARLAACGRGDDDQRARTRDRVGAVVEELRAEQPDAAFEGIAADVATPDGADALFAALPAVDILVNNLGIFAPTPLLEIDDDDLAALLGRQRDVRDPADPRTTCPGCSSAAGGACSSWRATRRS